MKVIIVKETITLVQALNNDDIMLHFTVLNIVEEKFMEDNKCINQF